MKKTLPSDHDISRKKTLFSESVQVTLSQNRKNVKVTVRDKLRLLNDELIRFKESGISYKIICSLLADKLNLYVSEQTLREHCQQELGFDKRVTGIGVSKKTAIRFKQATQQENEQLTTISEQPALQQIHSQLTGQMSVKANSQIEAQTKKLYTQLENY